MYACICRKLTEADVRRVGHAGVTAPEDLITLFALDQPTCCGGCLRSIQRLVALAEEGAAGAHEEPAVAAGPMAGRIAGAARTLLHTALHPAPMAAGMRRGER